MSSTAIGPQIRVINETGGVANSDPFARLPATLRTTLEEIRNPEAHAAYNEARKGWVSNEADKTAEFNTSTYCSVLLHLKELENLKSASVDSVGDYLVKVMFMGETYGNFLSGTVNLDSLAYITHRDNNDDDDPLQIRCPSVNLEQSLSLHLRYVDLLDNPLILSVSLVKDLPMDRYHNLEPFGYLTMDVLSLIRSGKQMRLRAPWVLIPERIPLDRVFGMAFLSGDIHGCHGLPTPEQQQRGNIMSIVMESMYRLPKELQNMTHGSSTSIEVYVSLPNCTDGTHFLFPGGEFRKIIVCDALDVDEDTVIEVPPFDEVGIPIFIQDDQCFHRHWASVPDFYPDCPWGATAILNSKCIPTDKEQLVGDMTTEMGDESWRGYLDSNDARIVWNSLHRHYMGVDLYKEMLDRLSKHTIWPMEVAVTHREEHIVAFERPSRSSVPRDGSAPRKSKTSWVEETVYDISVIYHGVAFIDLTPLLDPGVKSARFASRLYPYNEALFLAQSCSRKSAFINTLSNYQAVNQFGKMSKPTSEDEGRRNTNASNASKDKERKKTPGEQDKRSRKVDREKKATTLTGNALEKEKEKADKLATTNKSKNLGSLASGDETGVRLNLTNQNQFPFLICQINLKRALIPDVKDKEKKPLMTYVPTRHFPRRRLMNSSTAAKTYRRAVLEASAELSQEFGVQYMNKIVKAGVTKGIMSHKECDASYENVKKGFLFYLNASGRYLVLREHLRQAVSELIQQKCVAANPGGFKNQRNFQNFLHDVYMYMVDEMHEVLNTTSRQEIDRHEDIRTQKRGFKMKDEEVRSIGNLFRFAEEAFAQCDYENCHRIHIERIARSSDSSEAWTDFAVMWLARGDDRLAEIATREALSADSENLLALIIAGAIAGAHRDRRAISCLGSALKLRPLCPEIMVLLAAAHSNLGNDIASEYFYKKARFVHHLLTGRDVKLIEEQFGTISKDWKTVNDAATNFETLLSGGLTYNDETVLSAPGEQEGTLVSEPIPHEAASIGKNRKKSQPSSVGKRRRASRKSQDSQALRGRSPRGSRDSRIRASKDSGIQNILGDQAIVTDPQKSDPASPEQLTNPLIDPKGQRPVFEFPTKVTRDNVHLSKPPVLGPCLMITWNVTKLSRGKKVQPEMQYHEKLPNISNIGTEKPAEQGTILDEFSRILATEKDTDRVGDDDDEEAEEDEEEEVEEVGEHELKEYDSDRSMLLQDQGVHSIGKRHHHHRHHNMQKQRDRNRDIGNQAHQHRHHRQSKSTAEEEEATENEAGRKPGRRGVVFCKRVGSEFLWTAHLLLKLRLFDFLDGVLAREIAFGGKRGVAFLYLRAMSLHLRGRDKEALDFVHEAIVLEPENGVLWTLRGHCNYNMRESDEALLSYEKVLSLPHGREDLHLVYLRFGALCLEKNNAQLAKRVFLKRVHVSPTPYMWLAIGNTCYHLKQLEEAESAFAEANRLDNTNPVIWAHLSLVSLALGHQTLAEQSYKWAIRFGLKKCPLMDEIKSLHRELGYGNPAFPRIPHAIPHEYYVQRLGRERPFEIYKDALNFPNIVKPKPRFANTTREEELIKKLHGKYSEEKQKEFETRVTDLMNRRLSEASDSLPAPEPTQQPSLPQEDVNANRKNDVKASTGTGSGKNRKVEQKAVVNKLAPAAAVAGQVTGKPPLPVTGRRRSSGSRKLKDAI